MSAPAPLAEVKKIEDLSLNAWPSWQMQVYDGWILRYSRFYTHRTNCVEQIGASQLPLAEKVAFCEEAYARWNSPCVFKVSPLSDPELDPYLEARGYRVEHRVANLTRSLADVELDVDEGGEPPLTLEGRVGYAWMEGLFALKRMDDLELRRIVPAMYDAIPKDEVAVSLRLDGRVAATGLGILDRDYVGVYAIHVAEPLRRAGVASRIVRTILREGRRHGAMRAYLQCEVGNAPARALYEKFGFSPLYECHFRVGGTGSSQGEEGLPRLTRGKGPKPFPRRASPSVL